MDNQEPNNQEQIVDDNIHEDEHNLAENNQNHDIEELLKPKSKKKHIIKEIISWVLVFVVAFGAAYIVRNFIIVNAVVPSASMNPTIIEPSRLIAFRLSYIFSDPDRFDVIVFRFPDTPEGDDPILFVKRIIGLPGERVEIINGQIFINNSPVALDEWFLTERAPADNMVFYVPQYDENNPDSFDGFFVLGDNRNDSHDSRSWINSFVNRDDILGKAVFTYFPFNRMGSIR